MCISRTSQEFAGRLVGKINAWTSTFFNFYTFVTFEAKNLPLTLWIPQKNRVATAYLISANQNLPIKENSRTRYAMQTTENYNLLMFSKNIFVEQSHRDNISVFKSTNK